jgi:2-polyprenyl-3-methyl-5-hydroxy-6-metoxy-1,4-benzoquinol methylase
MLNQPQREAYFDGFNQALADVVPAPAKRILEVGCARGRLGEELKRLDPSRYVIGVEFNAEAAEFARTRLDEVHVCDVQRGLPDIAAGSIDCVIFGDVLEHLYDPEKLLRETRTVLAYDGLVAICVPNFAHFSVIKALLRSDLMYQPSGLIDATHVRFFTHATFVKMMLDAQFLPQLVGRIRSGGTEHVMPAATPLLDYVGMPADRALSYLDTYQYIVTARALPVITERFATESLTFVVCVNDDDQLNSNFLRSPCLQPGSPHEVILRRGMSSAAEGFHSGLEAATHDRVVLVQQDMYLPTGWDTRFVDAWIEAESTWPNLGPVGLFGCSVQDGVVTHAGRVFDRDSLLVQDQPLPAKVVAFDEILLGVRRDSGLALDPALGFHLYGVDLALNAGRAGLTGAVLDAPAFHNSLFATLSDSYFEAAAVLLAKWPDIRPLHTSMGQLDTMKRPSVLPVPVVDPRDAEISQLRTQLDLARHRAQLAENARVLKTWRRVKRPLQTVAARVRGR